MADDDNPPVGPPDRPTGEDDRPPERPAGEVRFTRKWFVLVVGAVIAAVVGVNELLRRSGSSLKGAVSQPQTLLGAFPVLNVERSVPDTPAERWVVTVDGLVERPLTIDRAQWATLPRAEETVDFHCVEGWSVDQVKWGGVTPATLLEQAGVKPAATDVVFHAAGGVYSDSLPLALVRDSQTLLADKLGDEPLPAGHGGPLRLVVPKQLGYKNVKWVVRLELTDRPGKGYWEQRGYPQDAPVG